MTHYPRFLWMYTARLIIFYNRTGISQISANIYTYPTIRFTKKQRCQSILTPSNSLSLPLSALHTRPFLFKPMGSLPQFSRAALHVTFTSCPVTSHPDYFLLINPSFYCYTYFSRSAPI